MAATFMNPELGPQRGHGNYNHGALVEEIPGLMKVHKDGRVERPPIIPNVPCNVVPFGCDIACKDVIIDRLTNVWGRIYVPRSRKQLPLLLYFHGGGFCVGSASWSCYHDFLAKLACKSGCVIISVNYRLAPENRLPAPYDDGIKALGWVKQHALSGSGDQKWWTDHCNFSRLFLAGDSAGANIVHNLAVKIGSRADILSPLFLKGTILIQPFFGGEYRTNSEKYMVQPPHSALSLTSSDVYWRLSLPLGANRDNPWSNPLAKGAARMEDLKFPPTMVFISEMDILKDRNLEFCNAMKRAGKKVEHVVYMGVGHAFQILPTYQLSETRTQEMMAHIKVFIHRSCMDL